MANEISYSLRLSLRTTPTVPNTELKWTESLDRADITQATAKMGGIVHTCPTAYAALTLPSGITTATLGYTMLKNLDTTNYITIGPKVGTTALMEPMIKLKAGQPAILFLDPTVALVGQANAAPVPLQVDVFEV